MELLHIWKTTVVDHSSRVSSDFFENAPFHLKTSAENVIRLKNNGFKQKVVEYEKNQDLQFVLFSGDYSSQRMLRHPY